MPAGSTGQLITDDKGAFTQKTVTLPSDRKFTVTLKRNGGFVLVLPNQP